jgi:glycosyltransferase involved in cell wall biosynthesis
MDITVALDARYTVAADGSVWSQTGMARDFWERYLEVFDAVRIVARATRAQHAPEGWLPVTGKNIAFHGVPDFLGPWQCVKRYPSVRAAIRAAAPAHGAVILRVGSQVANMLEVPLRKRNHPYALEVVGDPYEVFGPDVVEHPLRPFFRWHFTRRLSQQCMRAAAVAYVTKQALQERYPARCMSADISDVDLPQEAILDEGSVLAYYSSVELDPRGLLPRARESKRHGPYQVVTVGSLSQLYKGTDVLIDAVSRCMRVGFDLTAVIVGEGKYRPRLMAQAERLGVASRIRFTGQVTAGEPVRRILDASDLFVLPSRTEGLPRAMVEAMARGLPCVGTAVGGIPELLDDNELVPAGEPAWLAAKMHEVLRDPGRMERLSERNLGVARKYCGPDVAARRRSFYRHVRDHTERWEKRQRTG